LPASSERRQPINQINQIKQIKQSVKLLANER